MRIFAILAGFGSGLVTLFQNISYAQLQTRLATARDGFLDLASQDFFGTALPRLNAEDDDRFSGRIRREVFRDRLTRKAIDGLLFEITGAHPLIRELERPADIGGYGFRFAYGHSAYGGRGDRPAVFIRTRHAGQFGIPLVNGYGGYAGGYGVGRQVYCGPDMITGTGFTDAQLMAALDRIRAAGVTYWVNITNDPLPSDQINYLGTEDGSFLGTEDGTQIIL